MKDYKDLSFDEKCDLVRKTSISEDMSYDERLAMLKSRYGL